MPAPRRIEFEGAVYHVMARGNGRRRIYTDAVDYDLYLGELEITIDKYGWVCHGLCLMPNHNHLIIETPKPNLSAGMQRLNNMYARTFNRRHGCSDHLFRARFRSVLIERDEHMLEVNRYGVLNVVRARICKRPEDWPWSSFRPTAGLAPKPDYLTVDRILEYFGPDKRVAQHRYIDFVHSAHTPRSLGDLDARLRLGDGLGESVKAA